MSENITGEANSNMEEKNVHPVVFFFLILPYGVIQGFLTVTLGFLYSNGGVSVDTIAGLVGIGLLPNIFKFVWGPLTELTLTVKKWYIIANVLTAAGLVVMGLLPAKQSSIGLLGIIVLVSFFAMSFLGLTVSNFMAHDTTNKTKGRAGGYYNAGSVGGIGIGGGLGLFLAHHLSSPWLVGPLLALLCFACCLFLSFVKEPVSTIKVKELSKTLNNLFKDIWDTIKVRAGILGLFLCLLPFGTGAAGSLFAAMAQEWHTSSDTVALVTGVTGGIITSAGCLFGGWLCDIINRQLAYVLFGAFQALCAVGMAFCPHSPSFYIVWTLAYSFANGMAYAAFSAFVLEAICKGAAATKYNLYAGVSNIPIFLVTIIDGWANKRFGSAGMLNFEALSALVGIILFFVVKAAMRPSKAASVAVSA
jgi:PAT family beta-lactamase induction signal transducer AmpG